jgi:hypothetical protein
VYALYRGKRLYSVGLARDLRARLKQHLKDKHGQSWDRFSMYLTVGDDHVRELESLVLRIVKPSGNRQIGKFAKAENLRRLFTRLARRDSQQRLKAILGILERPERRARAAGRRDAPVLAGYFDKPARLRARYKGKLLRARVLRSGEISFAGKRYKSPSTAALAALPTRRAINGWWFWSVERAPGDWVRLREIRN